MEQICEKEKCTGCSACMNICSHNAIHIEESEPLGFIYPIIDAEKCIDCGLCARMCPANVPIRLNNPLKAFSVISKNHEDLISSASGGASSVLCQVILKRGGVVYGCVQYNYKDISHRRIERIEDYSLMKGSKYVQSNIGLTYCDVKNDLQKGREVLFTGTPCQIAGLKAYLRKDYDYLYLVDLVCHGVPSQKLLREDVESLLKDYPDADRSRICVEFRQKKRQQAKFEPNWGTFISYGVFGDGGGKSFAHKKKKQKFLTDNYITAFMAGTIFRENCYACPYAQSKRTGDITIADFWGLKGLSVPTTEGVSLLMPSTEKGLKLVSDSKSFVQYEERPIEEAINGNGQLMYPSPKPQEREAFISLYSINPQIAYNQSLRKYKKEYHDSFVVPKIYAKYKLFIESSALFRMFDKIPKFRGLVLKCASAYTRYNNIIP